MEGKMDQKSRYAHLGLPFSRKSCIKQGIIVRNRSSLTIFKVSIAKLRRIVLSRLHGPLETESKHKNVALTQSVDHIYSS
jgi:hypothetical protein